MKPFIRTPWTSHDPIPNDLTGELVDTDDLFYETTFGPSQTVPDQTMSIKEILDRYAKGLPLGGQRVPIYEPDSNLPDPRKLDLADREALAEQYTQELTEINQRIETLKQAKVDAERAAEEKREEEQFKRYQERLQAQQAAEGKK